MKANLVPAIENPCPVKWESMVGDEKRRYCGHCQLHVHNLSAMTTSERNEILAPSSEHKCITYLTREDTRTTEGNARLIFQPLSWLPRWLAVIAALFSASCDRCFRTTGVLKSIPPAKEESPAKNPHNDLVQ